MFVLIDCNNFFVSCERLFNPQLEGKPVIVLSSNDGCVVARSQEAKDLGIKMGEPYFTIQALCERCHVEVFSSNFSLYGNLSARVMSMLRDFCADIEIYSIDEAFLSFPDSEPIASLIAASSALRRKVKQWTGIPISIGIAPTKTLAKVANYQAKKKRATGICSLTTLQEQTKTLHSLPVEEVWGIGSRTTKALHPMGIRTAQEYRDADPLMIRNKFGVVGERILWELRGKDCLPLSEAAPKQSITCSRSFGQIVTALEDLEEAIANHVFSASRKLREQNEYANALYVFFEFLTDKGKGLRGSHSSTVTFSQPTSDTGRMIAAAKNALASLFQKELAYKKCGVILLNLVPEHSVHGDLFAPRPDPKRIQLAKTVDAINKQYGKETLTYAAMGTDHSWECRSQKRSNRFTSVWDELPIVY